MLRFFLTLLVSATSRTAKDWPVVVRHDFYVESDHGIRLFVRELIKGESKASDQKSILLVHGGRVPGLASFDLDVRPRSPSGIVDLYLSPAAGEIHDFHSSAKLGERQLFGNSFPHWTWWNNRDWIANGEILGENR